MRIQLLAVVCCIQTLVAQQDKGSYCFINTNLPLQENARTIQIISKEIIRQSGVTTVADLLQQVAGIDIRRRGIWHAGRSLHSWWEF